MIELILLDGSNIYPSLARPEVVLAQEELYRYETLRSDVRRREFLLGRILLKAALTAGNYIPVCSFSSIHTTCSATGKPRVAGAEFNLSHDKNVVLLALGNQEVGVDIESVQNFDAAMMEVCFTKGECRRIACSPHPDCTATLSWCLKEAAAKATGAGISSRLGKISYQRLYYNGGFLEVAGIARAYAVCSTHPIVHAGISLGMPRFDKAFGDVCKRTKSAGARSIAPPEPQKI